MWLTLYHLFIYPGFVTAMRIASLWSPKIRRALRGRVDWRSPVGKIKSASPAAFRVHFHAASVGEFEQAKPLIEALRSEPTLYRITASFFSPSGYDVQKDWPVIDGACYIPHDRQQEMNEFLNRITPDLIIVVRYDLWLEFMRQAKQRGIPVVLVCGVMRANSIRFFPGLRRFFSGLYGRLSMIHCVTQEDRESFERLAPHVPIETTGDTRFDRVVERLESKEEGQVVRNIRQVVGDRKVLVAGSTWAEDERLLSTLQERTDLFLVIVPHEPGPEEVTAALDLFPAAILLSQFSADHSSNLRGIIVDRIGLLADLYRLADIAYVGGGFGAGVHSVLEPAAFGVPVLTGPRIDRSRDATSMQAEGLLYVTRTQEEVAKVVDRFLTDIPMLATMRDKVGQFVRERLGATEQILRSLHKQGLLPSKEVASREVNDVNTSA